MKCCSCRAKKEYFIVIGFLFLICCFGWVCFLLLLLLLFCFLFFSSDFFFFFFPLSFCLPPSHFRFPFICLPPPLPLLPPPLPIHPFTPPPPTSPSPHPPQPQFRLFVVFVFRLVCSVTMAWSPDVTLTAFASLCCRFDYNSITMAWTKVFLLGACVVLVAMATSKKRQSAPNLLDMQQQLANVLTALT